MEDLKILVVNGEPFSDATATGITLCNLFAEIPKENVAQIYTADFPVRPDRCAKYFKLSASNLIRSNSKNLPVSDSKTHGKSRPLSRSKERVRKMLAPLLESMSYKVPSEVVRQLEVFRPDVVYTLGGSLRQLRLALSVSDKLCSSLAIHFMDDWPSTLYQSPALFLIRRKLEHLTGVAVKSASARLVISDAMAREYRARYGVDFVPFMNCVSQANIVSANVEAFEPIKTICYFGGLHLGRGEVVRKLARQIQEMGLSQELFIDLYCRSSDVAKYGAAFAPLQHVRFRDPVPPSAVAKVMQRAGSLLHVESFNEAHRRYTRLSISTKIPEYLASGRPIIAIGPSEVASIRYLQENDVGLVGTNTRPDNLSPLLHGLFNRQAIQRIITNANALVVKNHVAEVERRRFLSTLANIPSNAAIDATAFVNQRSQPG